MRPVPGLAVTAVINHRREPWKNRDRALKAGACAFFQKPPDNYELLDAMRNVLAAHGNGHNTTVLTEQATTS